MTTMLQFDDAESRQIEISYTTPDVVAQRRFVMDALTPQPGENALDIGSGPGFLANEIAERTGPSGPVTGIDPSSSMLGLAARRASANVTFAAGDATALPFPDASFDIVTATQVYEYIADLPRALTEARRVLRPGGRLLVLDTDWDSVVWHSSDPTRMRRVLSAWDEHLADPHLPRKLTGLLVAAGFTVRDRSTMPILNAGQPTGTYSAGLIGFVHRFVPGHGGVTQAEADAWRDDLDSLGDDYFFSVNRYLFLATA